MNQSSKNILTNPVFLDANILLEIVLGRATADTARQFVEEQYGNICISALTAHLIIHFGKSIVELPVLREFLADYTILALDAADFEWAFINIRNRDFEDALQLAVAIRNGCSQFVTFDRGLASSYSNLPSIMTTLLK